MRNDSEYTFKFVMDKEDIFIAAETVTKSAINVAKNGELGVYLLSFDLKKRIRKCDHVRRMSPCVIPSQGVGGS